MARPVQLLRWFPRRAAAGPRSSRASLQLLRGRFPFGQRLLPQLSHVGHALVYGGLQERLALLGGGQGRRTLHAGPAEGGPPRHQLQWPVGPPFEMGVLAGWVAMLVDG